MVACSLQAVTPIGAAEEPAELNGNTYYVAKIDRYIEVNLSISGGHVSK
jgi:hypothetical protein